MTHPRWLGLGSAWRLVSSGVPRHWRAARRAGAGPREASGAVLTSLLAFAVATRRGPRGWRAGNAVRHFAWQALLAARHGDGLATALGDAQEAGSADPADTRVDQANNRLGRAYGLAHAADLRAGSRRAALHRLTAVGGELWTSRELAAQPRADGTDPRDPEVSPRARP